MDTLYRHWLVLRMIPRHRRIATTEIHDRLQSEYGINTTLRTIQRDLITLESSEFPLECDNNRPAGWSWSKDAPAFDIPNMDPVTALTFKLTEQYLTRMFPKGVLTALRPYIAIADERLRLTTESSLSRWPNKVRVVSRNLTTISPAVSSEISDAVFKSVLEEKRFKVVYKTVAKKIKTYEVNPLGLTFVDGLTYLIASLNEHADPILLLLHRIKSIEILNKPVCIPEGFCLDEWVAELLTFPVGDAIELKLRFTSSNDAERLEESPLCEGQEIELMVDGSYELTANVEDTKQLRWWLNGFGDRVEVLAPQSLRQEFVKLAVKMGEMYLPARS